MRDIKYKKGFTLVELLVALMVMSIVLAAVATLTYALGTANETSDDRSRKQAQVRFATLRISELIRHCKLIWRENINSLAVWRADDNNNGQIDSAAGELVYIDAGPSRAYIQLCEAGADPMVLIPQCSNVQFSVHGDAPPETRRVSISFDLVEGGTTHNYQISAVLRSWAGHLLDAGGNIVGDDD